MMETQEKWLESHRLQQWTLFYSKIEGYDGYSEPKLEHYAKADKNVEHAKLKLLVASGRGVFYPIPSIKEFPGLMSKTAQWHSLVTDQDIERYNSSCTIELDKIPRGDLWNLVKQLNDFIVTSSQKKKCAEDYADAMNPSNRIIYCGCCGVVDILNGKQS